MSKRRADSDLNHDNWDQDEPTFEETGVFKKAPQEELSRRKFRVARRRVDEVVTEKSAGPSVFKSFTGFGSIGSGGASKFPSFNFASKSPSSEGSKFEATSFKLGSSSSVGSFSNSLETSFTSAESSPKKESLETIKESPKTNGTREEATKKSSSDVNSEGSNKAYLSSLRALNEGVLKWIQKHLDENININLNPVFDDYRKHFDELQKKYKPKFTKAGVSTTETKDSSKQINGNSSPEKKSPFSSYGSSAFEKSSPSNKFESSVPVTTENKPALFSFASKESASLSFDSKVAKPKESTSLFGSKETTSFGTTDSKPENLGTFSFGSSDSKPKETGGFSFGSTGPLTFGAKEGSTTTGGFSFGTSATPAFSFGSGSIVSGTTHSSKVEEDDAPPKPEVVEVKEDDATYEKKCKLFYKKDGVFTDKGVGTLFLKPAGDTNKTQLVIRAATNLGNVLLNIVLNSSLPTQRMGKNNVLIVCVPNPPVDPKAETNTPVTMLIRVKTSEDADELLKKIDEHKDT